ncbi:MAG: hypothetical protein ACRC0G_12150 [Fusobacteriaceae bacterium]
MILLALYDFNKSFIEFYRHLVTVEMKVVDLRVKDLRVTSLEILEVINKFRDSENKAKLAHYDLLKIIRIEFQEEIDQGKISDIFYSDTYGREQPMFKLSTNQARQILMRESRIVRKNVIAHIEDLENKLYLLESAKASKKLQMELMEDLHDCLPELERDDALNYIKANTVVNKIVSDIFFFPKMLKKIEMNPDMLMVREAVLADYVKLFDIFGNNHDVREALLRKHKQQLIEEIV